MVTVHYQSAEDSPSTEILLESGETVLDGLLRSGFDIPHGCKSGACQSCMMESTSPSIPEASQVGLKSAQKAKGCFLACSCLPKEDLQVKPAKASTEKVVGHVIEKTRLNDDVLQLRLESSLKFRAGQYVTLWRDSNIARSYSIASTTEEGFVELHIKIHPGGAFSEWAARSLAIGDALSLQGPIGECFYLPEQSQQPLFLSGIGTGAAPLYGIIKDAIAEKHSGDITVLLGGKRQSSFYLAEQLRLLANKHTNLSVFFVSQTLDDNDQIKRTDVIEGDIYEEIQRQMPSFSGVRVFLCGAESFVKKARKLCFLGGASMKEISSDTFVSFSSS